MVVRAARTNTAGVPGTTAAAAAAGSTIHRRSTFCTTITTLAIDHVYQLQARRIDAGLPMYSTIKSGRRVIEGGATEVG